jgi:hypothetical protein
MARQHFAERELAVLYLGYLSFRVKSRNLSILLGNVRDVSTTLDMPTNLSFALLIAIFAPIAGAQESLTPTPSATPGESPSPLISPQESLAPPPTPEQSPSATSARTVRISFIPPPLEGTISLGIYDKTGKLVRVLHQEAEVNEFTIGPDALLTQWDGKDDNGQDLPAGKYHARGYLVGHLKVEDLGQSPAPESKNNATASVKMKLMPNPLANEKQSIVGVAAGFDSDGSYLKTMDDLPLLTVSETPNLVRILIAKNSDRSITIWQDDGVLVHQFRVSSVDKMMAFDCGEFELK